MKSILKLIISLFITIITVTFFISCKKSNNEINHTIIIDSFFNSETGRLNAGNFNNSVKLTIKTGKYNYVGHFRIVYEEEEIFNSVDYDYFVPKGTTVYSKLLDATYTQNQLNLKFEVLDNNPDFAGEYNYNKFYNNSARMVYAPIQEKKPLTYSIYRMDDYSLDFNINIKKGLTYMLFFRNITSNVSVVESKKEYFVVSEFNNTAIDSSDRKFGYMLFNSKKDSLIDAKDIEIHYQDLIVDVYLGNMDNTSFEFDFSSSADNIFINFINLEETQNFNVKYTCIETEMSHIENGKNISQKNVYEYKAELSYYLRCVFSNEVQYYISDPEKGIINSYCIIDNISHTKKEKLGKYSVFTYHFVIS